MALHGRRTGLKRHRIDVEEYTTTRSDEGDTIRTWSSVALWWAEIQPTGGFTSAKGGVEHEHADQQKAIRTHRIYMRFFEPGITENMRIVFNSRIFSIVAVINPGERGCDTILDVKEVELAEVF